ncbi:hypothetical protein [Demequina maris]|uniref:hypothetical protein n=1 Tax=Demequina maris TaxID=1638982 RepID=UPI000783FF60|nr:hypothetical protein [Demequina maris]
MRTRCLSTPALLAVGVLALAGCAPTYAATTTAGASASSVATASPYSIETVDAVWESDPTPTYDDAWESDPTRTYDDDTPIYQRAPIVERRAAAFGSVHPIPQPDDTVIKISSGTCQGDPEVTVDETDTTITLSLVTDIVIEGNALACAEGLTIHLDAPVGDRDIIDSFTGEPIHGPRYE